MAIRFKLFLFALLIIPSTVFASDPTPLFVMFIEIPILVVSCFVLLMCFFAPKVGGVLLALLLIGSFFILAWALDVGYMGSAGRFLCLSFIVDIVGVVVIIKKKSRKMDEPIPDDGKFLNLTSLLKLGYSAERAAAFAYQGHAGSVRNDIQKVEIKKIENEEWQHRDNLLRMMSTLGVQPSKWLEFKYYSIGKFISGSCYVIGYFMPMYFAGRLESGNVNEYLKMADIAKGTVLEVEIPCILEMARVEKEHEQYFLNQIQEHWMLPIFHWVFGWGPGSSYNTISLNNKTAD